MNPRLADVSVELIRQVRLVSTYEYDDLFVGEWTVSDAISLWQLTKKHPDSRYYAEALAAVRSALDLPDLEAVHREAGSRTIDAALISRRRQQVCQFAQHLALTLVFGETTAADCGESALEINRLHDELARSSLGLISRMDRELLRVLGLRNDATTTFEDLRQKFGYRPL